MYKLDIIGNDGKVAFTVMAYAASSPSGKKKFGDARVNCKLASDLDIVHHVRNKLPVIGEPEPPEPNQPDLPDVEQPTEGYEPAPENVE